MVLLLGLVSVADAQEPSTDTSSADDPPVTLQQDSDGTVKWLTTAKYDPDMGQAFD